MNRRFKLLKNNKKTIYLLSVFVLFIAIGIINVAYSKYGSGFEVNVNTTAGEMIIDAIVDDKEEYVENGVRYFLLTVKNSKDEKVTSAAIDYKITVTNQEGSSNGRFYYVDQNGNSNEELTGYQKELIIDGYSLPNIQDQMVFKIYIKVDSGLTEDVTYNVTLDAVQKEMK